MSYTDLKNLYDRVESDNDLNLTQEQLLQIRRLVESTKLPDDPVDHLYYDITFSELGLNLNEMLNDNYLNECIENATKCLQYELKCRRIKPQDVRDWIGYVLKTWDVLILHYIYDIRKDEPEIFEDHKERDVYKHLESYNGLFKKLAVCLHSIYKARNTLEHRQYYSDESGRIVFKIHGSSRRTAILNDAINGLRITLPPFVNALKNRVITN